MRTLLASTLTMLWLLAAVPAALAAGRADTFYTFVCIDPDGNVVTAESVDAHAIEQGGKLMGSANWAAAHPDYDCHVEGPFEN
jgi:hypothetical protein